MLAEVIVERGNAQAGNLIAVRIGEGIVEQRDDVEVVIDLLLDIPIHLHARFVILFDQRGCLVGVQLLIVEERKPCAGLTIISNPANDFGRIVVIIRPLEAHGLQRAGLRVLVQDFAFHVLDVYRKAGFRQGGLRQNG